MFGLAKHALCFVTVAISCPAIARPCPPDDTSDRCIHWTRLLHYPDEARKNGMEGTVEFRLEVDRAGEVAGCTIKKSSGYQLLDDETCAQLVEYAHFYPALDHDGNAVPSFYESKMVWFRKGHKADKETKRD